MHHPFETIPQHAVRHVVPIGIGVSSALGVILVLVLEAGPGLSGLAQLVMAGSVEGAKEVLSPWSATDRIYVAFIAGFDFLFGIVWANTMALTCIWAATKYRSSSVASLGAPLAWLLWVAMILDIPENGGYLIMMAGPVEAPWPMVSTLALYPRVVIFSAGVLYIVGAIFTASTKEPNAQNTRKA